MVIPLAITYLKALSINPPLHPMFPSLYEQSTNCYSEKSPSPFPKMAEQASNDPVVEKAQHDPHCPWFLTAETSPFVVQSTEAGADPVATCLNSEVFVWVGNNPR